MKSLVLALALATLCSPAAADTPAFPQYTITDLGLLPTPEESSMDRGAFALNDAGQVVGGDGHAFLWSGGRRTDLGVLPKEYIEDFAFSVAWGINNRGQVVGSSGSFGPVMMSGLQFARGILYENHGLRQLTVVDTSFEPYAVNDRGQIVGLAGYRGFLYENGRLTELGALSGVPVGNRSTARAVNNSGQIVGWSTVNSRLRVKTGELPTHACLWQANGKAVRQRDLGTLPGWVNSYAYGINVRGEVVGSVSDATGRPYGIDTDRADTDGRAGAFLWRDGRMTGLGALPGCRDSEAYGINDAGVVVGSSGHRAFLWRDGRMRDLNALLAADSGWVLEEARAINAKGQIVGSGRRDGQSHAFLLTPQ